MYPGSLPYAVFILFVASLTGGIAIYAFSHPEYRGGKFFGWLMTSMTIWSFFYALELLASTLSGKVMARELEYLGIASTPILWFIFALEYTNLKNWLTPNKCIALSLIPILTIGLALTNEFHGLIWTKTGLDPQGYPGLVVLGHGIWFWFNGVFSYSLVLAGIAVYLGAYSQAWLIHQQQMKVMVTGSIIPLVTNAISLVMPMPLHGLDPTPFTFALSGILLLIGLFRFGLLDLTPIAASQVMEHLHDPVIIVDVHKRLTDLNPAGKSWLKVGDEVIGRDVFEALPLLNPVWESLDLEKTYIQLEIKQGDVYQWFEINISPIYESSRHLQGSIIVAHKVSHEPMRRAVEQNHASQIELLNSITRTALETTEVHDLLQTLADHANTLLNADGAFITLWDETKHRVIPAAAYGEYRDTYRLMKVDPDENTLTASVLREERPIPVEDAYNSPYINPQLVLDVPTRSVFGLPLIANGKKLGAVLISFNQLHKFTAEEIVLGEQAAAQIALALNKVQLFEAASRRAAQMEMLQEVSRQTVESLKESEVCQKTVDAMVNVLGYDEAAISLLVENEKLELIAISGTKDFGFSPGFRQNVGQGIMGYVAKTQEPYFSEDIVLDPYYYHPHRQGSGAAIGVPIRHEEQLMGVLYVQSEPPHTIIQDDIQTLQAIASHVVIAIQKARLYEDANEHLTSMTALQSVTQTVNSSLELDSVFRTVVQLLKNTYGYTYVSIYQLDGSTLQLGAQIGYPEKFVLNEIPISHGITGLTVRTRQPQFISNTKTNPNFLIASYEVESEICVPLIKNEKILGVINVESDSKRPLTEKDMELLIALANPVAMAIDNARLHAEVTSLALTDSMTGLPNRRAFDQAFETEVARAHRYGHTMSLIMIDMDSFKEYNDVHGHPAGDERLKTFAGLLMSKMRDPDMAARYGGEEFAIILPHTTKEGAMALAERLRASAEAQSPDTVSSGTPSAGYTISVGVATFPSDGDTANEILLAADNAELAAKHLGKNRVCVSNISE